MKQAKFHYTYKHLPHGKLRTIKVRQEITLQNFRDTYIKRKNIVIVVDGLITDLESDYDLILRDGDQIRTMLVKVSLRDKIYQKICNFLNIK